ncbi:MAG: 3-dehydroquinate synthase [Saprospiraceae bacterium]|nr:MAG: 3-dehydroquinate synthase [Saprospiraceae bacterium]
MTTVSLPDYAIFVGDFWSEFRNFLSNTSYSRHFVIVDEHTARYCMPRLQQQTPDINWLPIIIPPGEQHKNIQTCNTIWQQLMDNNANRGALVVNLGGGVIGDMGGFCASTFKRGMDFVQMPTTLLSQVDASIGGKLGIDFMQVKNSIGLFRNPQGVWIDPAFLQTLPFREIRSGFAEIIKHSLIADPGEWERIQAIQNLESITWSDFLLPSLQIKKDIVIADPFEKGLRKALNFGHTIGHAVEGMALESEHPLLHGEAIAIGMICETYLSHRILGLPLETLDFIAGFLVRIYGHHPLAEALYVDYLQLMTQDKKNENNQINFSLIPDIGKVKVNQTADKMLIRESLDYYNSMV